MVWKITFTTLGDLPSMLLFFITHVRKCVMGAMPMVSVIHLDFTTGILYPHISI